MPSQPRPIFERGWLRVAQTHTTPTTGDTMTTTTARPLNGATLIAALPLPFDSGSIVAVQWRGDEYVTAWVPSLDSSEWVHGHYFRTRAEALADLQARVSKQSA